MFETRQQNAFWVDKQAIFAIVFQGGGDAGIGADKMPVAEGQQVAPGVALFHMDKGGFVPHFFDHRIGMPEVVDQGMLC